MGKCRASRRYRIMRESTEDYSPLITRLIGQGCGVEEIQMAVITKSGEGKK